MTMLANICKLSQNNTMNIISMVGRITRDPEKKVVKDTCVVDFSIAVNKKYKPKDGGADADFFRVKVWGKAGEYVYEYLGKGRLISLQGRLDTNTYEKDSKRVTDIFITADNVTGLDRARENNRKANHDEDAREPFTGRLGDEYDPFLDE
ncbi:MAG: single-stranded DNA-binding protein [Pseudomonadota bacterium]|jgi:single-strand DNA-binding protein